MWEFFGLFKKRQSVRQPSLQEGLKFSAFLPLCLKCEEKQENTQIYQITDEFNLALFISVDIVIVIILNYVAAIIIVEIIEWNECSRAALD